MSHHPNHNSPFQSQPQHQQHQQQHSNSEQSSNSSDQHDSLAAILERANRKLAQEIVPIDSLTHKQAILEQRIRLTDEALKKLSSQQLRLGIETIPRSDLEQLLNAASISFDQHADDQHLKELVRKFLSTL